MTCDTFKRGGARQKARPLFWFVQKPEQVGQVWPLAGKCFALARQTALPFAPLLLKLYITKKKGGGHAFGAPPLASLKVNALLVLQDFLKLPKAFHGRGVTLPKFMQVNACIIRQIVYGQAIVARHDRVNTLAPSVKLDAFAFTLGLYSRGG